MFCLLSLVALRQFHMHDAEHHFDGPHMRHQPVEVDSMPHHRHFARIHEPIQKAQEENADFYATARMHPRPEVYARTAAGYERLIPEFEEDNGFFKHIKHAIKHVTKPISHVVHEVTKPVEHVVKSAKSFISSHKSSEYKNPIKIDPAQIANANDGINTPLNNLANEIKAKVSFIPDADLNSLSQKMSFASRAKVLVHEFAMNIDNNNNVIRTGSKRVSAVTLNKNADQIQGNVQHATASCQVTADTTTKSKSTHFGITHHHHGQGWRPLEAPELQEVSNILDQALQPSVQQMSQ